MVLTCIENRLLHVFLSLCLITTPSSLKLPQYNHMGCFTSSCCAGTRLHSHLANIFIIHNVVSDTTRFSVLSLSAGYCFFSEWRRRPHRQSSWHPVCPTGKTSHQVSKFPALKTRLQSFYLWDSRTKWMRNQVWPALGIPDTKPRAPICFSIIWISAKLRLRKFLIKCPHQKKSRLWFSVKHGASSCPADTLRGLSGAWPPEEDWSLLLQWRHFSKTHLTALRARVSSQSDSPLN